MACSPFVAYIDETGDHGLDRINPTMPVFVLCAALYRIEDYLRLDQTSLTNIKFRFWYHDNVVFHSRTMRRRLPPFEALKSAQNRMHLISAINEFFVGSCVTLIAAAIDKPRHKLQYFTPGNPYFLALQFVMERIFGHIRKQGGRWDETVCILESRGEDEDRELSTWFAHICGGDNQWNCPFPFRVQFASKLTNMPGLQVADLAAYPIARYVENPGAPRPEWTYIEPRIRRSPSGKMLGWGLKIFPPLPE